MRNTLFQFCQLWAINGFHTCQNVRCTKGWNLQHFLQVTGTISRITGPILGSFVLTCNTRLICTHLNAFAFFFIDFNLNMPKIIWFVENANQKDKIQRVQTKFSAPVAMVKVVCIIWIMGKKGLAKRKLSDTSEIDKSHPQKILSNEILTTMLWNLLFIIQHLMPPWLM